MYCYLQIESRRRFRIIRSWDQDGCVVSGCYVSQILAVDMAVSLSWKHGLIP